MIYNTSSEETSEFEAGHEYLITLTVYGKMDVKVGAEMIEWGTGGDYVADTEFKPGEN